ncbi:MAG: VWA domain-containing protein [Mariprofundaceae bacterium]|nr:VWA domain-containing protein [Mariprofundaceae bacterium]
MSHAKTMSPHIAVYWHDLGCRFPKVEKVFEDCMIEALRHFSSSGMTTFIEQARFLGKIGHGADPLLIYLEEAPVIASEVGEEVLPSIIDCVHSMFRSPNGKAIVPFLQTLAAATRRLHSSGQLGHYLELVLDMMNRTTGSIHGHHQTHPSPGLPDFLKQIPMLTQYLSLEGIQHWVDYGICNYTDDPERQKDYFSFQSPDARAMFQKERQGTLLVDHERHLDLYLQALWQQQRRFIPYSLAFDELRKPMPYYDDLGIRFPDVYSDHNTVSGLNRYRAALAHMMAHQCWSSKMVVDNWSPFQRLGVELFEDSRMDYLMVQHYPGLRKILIALHPMPVEDDLQLTGISLIRLRLALLSRSILDPCFQCHDEMIKVFSARFFEVMQTGLSSSEAMADLGIAFITRVRNQTDLLPKVYFDNTEVDYRDDNRNLWIYIENSDEEECYDEPNKDQDKNEINSLPPKHYDEWDEKNNMYRPDWVTLYEALHAQGSPEKIDALLSKHARLAKQMKRLLDLLKPQDRTRIRFQEDGSELDLDVAVRSLIDLKAGSQPDLRINMSHRTDGRDIAVTLLLDLSQSLNEKVTGSTQTILELSQEAVSLLAWSVQQLGDPLAIAGFHSNTRHDVRYYHIKGFDEPWGDTVKSRLAAMQAGYSTRMGAAMRHAGHYLSARKADKKLMLILTDGQPSDIDTKDKQHLISDAHKAVQELDQQGIYSYCINLDQAGDAYVPQIFGGQYTIIDHIERLPEKLPELFIALTK